MKIIEVDEELYQYIAAQTQSIGESASDILRRLLNLPTHATSSVDFFESVASAETPKSAVHSEPVLAEKTTEASQPKVEPIEPPKAVKKQSDEAINHIVDKVRALLNSAEFKEEPKAVVRFLSILRFIVPIQKALHRQPKACKAVLVCILLVMKERCLWQGIILNQNKFQIHHIG